MKTKIKLLLLLISILLLSCATPNYLPKQYKIGEVEYFDLEDFNKKKKKKYTAYYYVDKKIEILQSQKPDYFYEEYGVYEKGYKLIKEYYLNGAIKERGKEYFTPYSDNFKIGKWEYFDEQGNLLEIKDMDGKDRRYNMTYKEAFRRVWWHFGFSKKGVHIRIMPGNDRLFWVFSKNGKRKAVDMNTGKVYDASITQGNDIYRGDEKLD